MITVVNALLAARALISDPERWTTKALARRADGSMVSTRDRDAASWCAMGAVIRVCGPDVDLAVRVTDALLQASDGCTPLSVRNDDEGHEWVMALFSAALVAEEAKEREANAAP